MVEPGNLVHHIKTNRVGLVTRHLKSTRRMYAVKVLPEGYYTQWAETTIEPMDASFDDYLDNNLVSGNLSSLNRDFEKKYLRHNPSGAVGYSYRIVNKNRNRSYRIVVGNAVRNTDWSVASCTEITEKEFHEAIAAEPARYKKVEEKHRHRSASLDKTNWKTCRSCGKKIHPFYDGGFWYCKQCHGEMNKRQSMIDCVVMGYEVDEEK